MIASLEGTFQERLGDQFIIDVRGVGYLVTVSSSLLELSLKLGDPIKVIIFTDVKENAIALYGFSSLMEREVFLLLKKVKGIGPKHSLAVLSALGAEGVLGVVGRGDLASLQSVPGIGRKTAERLLVELREVVGELAFDREELHSKKGSSRAMPAQVVEENSTTGDAVLALEKLGFPKERAKSAVERALASVSGNVDAGELLRLSLGQLS